MRYPIPRPLSLSMHLELCLIIQRADPTKQIIWVGGKVEKLQELEFPAQLGYLADLLLIYVLEVTSLISTATYKKENLLFILILHWFQSRGTMLPQRENLYFLGVQSVMNPQRSYTAWLESSGGHLVQTNMTSISCEEVPRCYTCSRIHWTHICT